jgi:hypothetical protein
MRRKLGCGKLGGEIGGNEAMHIYLWPFCWFRGLVELVHTVSVPCCRLRERKLDYNSE